MPYCAPAWAFMSNGNQHEHMPRNTARVRCFHQFMPASDHAAGSDVVGNVHTLMGESTGRRSVVGAPGNGRGAMHLGPEQVLL